MTEYEGKRRFVENDLAQLLCSIDQRIAGVEYIHGKTTETVFVGMENGGEYAVNVTGDSNLYIVIDVLSHLFGRAEYGLRQMTTVKKLHDEISGLKELQEQIGHALSDLDDAVFDLQRVLQSTAQNDAEEDKPDEA